MTVLVIALASGLRLVRALWTVLMVLGLALAIAALLSYPATAALFSGSGRRTAPRNGIG